MAPSRKSVSQKVIASVADAQAALGNAASMKVLSQNLVNLVVTNLEANDLQDLGPTPEALGGSVSTIVCFELDCSSSVESVAALILASANRMVKALQDAKGSDAMTLTLIRFNHEITVVVSNKPLDDITAFTDADYFASGGTALYDALAYGIANALAYEELLMQSGYNTEVIFAAMTDGADRHSQKARPSVVKGMLEEIMARKRNWKVAMIGFKTWEQVDYNDIGHQCGIDEVVEVELPQIPAGATAEEEKQILYQCDHKIRQIFDRVSKSIIRQSQAHVSGTGAGTSGGGFLNVN